MSIKRIMAALLLMAFMSFFVSPLTGEVQAATTTSTLPANTPVTVSLKENISTDSVVAGKTVEFVVTQAVVGENGKVLIQAGAPAVAKVTSAKPKRRIGKPGEVTIADFYAVATDGTYVPISGSITGKAKSKMALSITLSVIICPLFLLMRGKDANIPAGTQRTFYTVSATNINAPSY